MKFDKKVLICVDEDIMLTALKFRLEKQGFEVVHVRNMQEAETAILKDNFNLIIADLMMKGNSAVDLAKWAREKNSGKPVPFLVMATLEDDVEILEEALNNGAGDFIMKPFKPVELYFRIHRIVPDLGI